MENTNPGTIVTLYSRPGCPYCMILRRGLRKKKINFREINIWKNPDSARKVRAVANGFETVPTVFIGKNGYVNPSAKDIVEILNRSNNLRRIELS